jgi:hypothetical protein
MQVVGPGFRLPDDVANALLIHVSSSSNGKSTDSLDQKFTAFGGKFKGLAN